VQEVQLQATGGTALSSFNALARLPKGQALVIDLDGRGVLIALMRAGSEDRYWAMYREACGLVPAQGEAMGSYVGRVVDFRGTCPLRIDQLPDLLATRSKFDPHGLKSVTPQSIARVLGPEVVFKSAWFESTSDPVSNDIGIVLPWTRSEAPDNQAGFLAGINVGFKILGIHFHIRI
jgi:hypothetical protein